VGQGDWLEAVQQLKADGKIRSFGVSINDHQPGSALELVRSGVVDTVQVIYNVFDQSPQDELFPAVMEHNVGVIVRVPFDEGSLAGRVRPSTNFPEGDFRNSYFGGHRRKQVWDRVEALVHELGITVEQLPEVALRYTLSHPAVSTVIPGMRSLRSVEANLQAEAKGYLSDPELEVLRRHRWIRNFYQSPEGD
jgi:aryl-alcohol dehydrogenase-like predicted oxidoreductase